MFKRLFLVLVFFVSSPAFVFGEGSSFNFPKSISEETLGVFFEFAVNEYENANYGLAKDFFVKILNATDSFPQSNFYLGKIYSEVPYFYDAVIAKQYFIKATNSKISPDIQQKSYAALINLTKNPDLILMYAKASHSIMPTAEAKKTLIKAYQGKYDETQDISYMTSANIVIRALGDTKDMPIYYFNATNYTEK